ncbi:MAG TPA: hypothetical protein PLL77_15105 [Pyrinomonadaceae bacterium]|nr:hypothetical protein [Pyrinomonadaceae bacterium]
MNSFAKNRESERGSAGVKFVIVVVAIVLFANAGLNYVPVAYNAESLKSEMSTAVLQGLAISGKLNPVDNVKARIAKAIVQNDIPADAVVDVKQAGNALTAHVTYTKEVNILPFGMYKYMYKFDHTATPTGFLMKQY